MKTNHLLDENHIEFSEEPLFLGSGRNIARLELNIEQHIQKATDNAVGLMWFATDFSYIEDAKDYALMETKLRELFLKNLKFQQMADSAAARSVAECFIPCTTNPQLESWWYQHAFFENNIHSKTYAEIIKALPVDAKAVFDTIMIDDHILARARTIMPHFEKLVQMNAKMILDSDYYVENHRKAILMALFALNALEAILFKSSFLTTFAFKENGLMNATGDAIKKINLDEIGHYSMTVNLLNRLRKDPEWAYLFKILEPQIYALYDESIKADYAWIDYLFEDGVILLGIGDDVLKGYVDYNAKVVMTSIGLTPFKTEVFNPCSWATKYSKSSNVQTAQKEKGNANYLLGKLNTHIPYSFWSTL
jgi:ribonucleotide reductase beta subunit family protein with ferritin-like domain